jgi:hypothetical protein
MDANKPVIATIAQIAATFTEWERRYRENPEQFRSEAEKLLRDTPQTYGDSCAPYFIEILSEVQAR